MTINYDSANYDRDTNTLIDELGDRAFQERTAEAKAIGEGYFDGLIQSRLNDAAAEIFQSLIREA